MEGRGLIVAFGEVVAPPAGGHSRLQGLGLQGFRALGFRVLGFSVDLRSEHL